MDPLPSGSARLTPEAAFEARSPQNFELTSSRGHYVPIAQSPVIRIVPGPPKSWKALLDDLRVSAEAVVEIESSDADGQTTQAGAGRG